MTDYEYLQAIIARGFEDEESCEQFREFMDGGEGESNENGY